MNEQEKECCPKFNPAPWDGAEFEWNNKKFIKDKVFTLFYMPINFGGVMTRSVKKLNDAGTDILDGITLSDHTSKWNMNIYLATDRDIPNAENTTLSGKYISKVYEGSYKNMATWENDFKEYIKTKGKELNKTYMWYTTCPKCARKYGKNYVVFIGEIK